MNRQSAHGPTTVDPPPSDDSAIDRGTVIRRVETLAEYRACVALQELTWGEGFSERVPVSVLLVAQKLGGVAVAAFEPSGRIVGFVFGLTGPMHGRLVHWSDMLAVHPSARGCGIGERLKRRQGDLVRGLGIATMHWTFDPLVARNAHLNLVRLGARATEYVPNMYGDGTGSPLHGAMPTDRLVVSWDLMHDHVTRGSVAPRPGRVVNSPDADGRPTVGALPDAAGVRVAVPHDVQALPTEQRAAWRATTRAAFLAYLARGYEIVGFQRGGDGELPCYELARPSGQQPSTEPVA
jgi:predicted GNAT superfamily acetyltransferase